MKLHALVAASLAIAGLSPLTIALPANAAEAPTAYTNCGLRANQAANGWTCTEDVTQTYVSRTIGNGQRCQDAYKLVVIYRAYNPAGNLAEDKTIIIGSDELSDWGPSYWKLDGCHYDEV